jgi:hypothetical protein
MMLTSFNRMLLRLAVIALLGTGLSPSIGTADDPCEAIDGIGFVKEGWSPTRYTACGFPAASITSGLVVIADIGTGWGSCTGLVCLYQATTGRPLSQWYIGGADDPRAEQFSGDIEGLEAFLHQQAFTPMTRVWAELDDHKRVRPEYVFGELHIVFDSNQTLAKAHLTVEVAGRVVRTAQFPSQTLHCHDGEIGARRAMSRVPGSVEVWAMEGLPAIVVLATYYGLEFGCSRFDWFVVGW